MRARLTRSIAVKAGLLLAAGAVLSMAGAAVSQGADGKGVRKVRFGGDTTETRIVIELDQAAKGRIVADGADGRLVLSLVGPGASSGLDGTGSGLVQRWAVQARPGGSRLELSAGRPIKVRRRFLLAPAEGSTAYRYVLDIAPVGPAVIAQGDADEPAAAPVRALRVASRPPARKVVVIDAGHGGKDPGARGRHVVEKDVTLAAARTLRAKLEKTGRYRVVLTRGEDAFVPLPKRVQIARRAKADLFIAIHADAVGDPTLRGASVYTLSDSGSERAARKVIEQGGYFMKVSLPGRDRSVNQILLDLTQRATKNQSSRFAEGLVQRLGQTTPLLRRSHRRGGFVVLLAPDVPAVLLEMGFLTNPQDEAVLRDKAKRTRMMDGVVAAIDDYFKAPSPGTHS